MGISLSQRCVLPQRSNGTTADGSDGSSEDIEKTRLRYPEEKETENEGEGVLI